MGFLFAAISLGLLGSLHCVGMCGPLALALPVHHKNISFKIVSIFSYNLGRALTYFLLGVFFGLIGQGFAIFGLQQILSISIGALILVSILIPKVFRFDLLKNPGWQISVSRLKSKISNYINDAGTASFLIIGMLNGLLPCGLVYMAIAGAIATGNSLNGGLFMAFFGVGTIPAMFAIMWFGQLISIKFRSGIRKAFPYMISVIAIMMILRGLNLGIPYLSPKMDTNKAEVSCHEETKECCRK
jgi:sulfite exporter TauE/SafE